MVVQVIVPLDGVIVMGTGGVISEMTVAVVVAVHPLAAVAITL